MLRKVINGSYEAVRKDMIVGCIPGKILHL